jgi:hypothetical protein
MMMLIVFIDQSYLYFFLLFYFLISSEINELISKLKCLQYMEINERIYFVIDKLHMLCISKIYLKINLPGKKKRR